MVWVPGGEFSMGASDPMHMPMGGHEPMGDARPIHRVYVDGFWMDDTEVTNAEFAKFVAATGYLTVAERTPKAEDYPGAIQANLKPGSIVFNPPASDDVVTGDHYQWWKWVDGANWKHPHGPGTSIKGKDNAPVVHVAFEDAEAYAKWAGKRIPTEAEYEFAARGGLSGKVYAWGDELRPGGKWMANTLQGSFPKTDTAEDGFQGASSVKQFPSNGYGLYDVTGNVWEWTSDWYTPDYYGRLAESGTVAKNPKGPDASFDPAEPNDKKKVQRGGSFLCTEQYCTRYMVGTRGKGEVTSGSDHVGFRTVKDAAPSGS